MILFSSGKYQTEYTTSYYKKHIVSSVKDFQNIVCQEDYCFAEFKDGMTQGGQHVSNHRANIDWVRSDCLYADFDDGYKVKDFQIEFEKYEYYLATSKSHRILKDGKSCDRFHVVFPIHSVEDQDQHKGYLKVLHKYMFGMEKLDRACIDSSRFFYAFKESTCLYNKGKSIGTIIHRLWEKEPVKVPKPIPVISSSYNRNIISKLDIAFDHGWFDDYSSWIFLGMALKTSGFDLSVWQKYSYTTEDKKKAAYRWQGFSDDGKKGLQYLLDICKNVQKYYKA